MRLSFVCTGFGRGGFAAGRVSRPIEVPPRKLKLLQPKKHLCNQAMFFLSSFQARVNCKEVGALVSRSGGLRQFMDD